MGRYVIRIFQSRKKPLTTAELLDEIEKLSDGEPVPDTIYITPPDDNGFDSNEDSGDEDCNDPNRLNSKQLQAQAETNMEEEISDNEDTEDSNEVAEPEERQKKSQKKRHWVEGDLNGSKTKQTNNEYLPVLTMSEESEPLEFLELFLNLEVLELLVKNSVLYAGSKNCRLEIGNDEMLVFIAVLYVSGYVPVPRRRMFWEGRDDTRNILVYNSIRRNRFEEIFRFIHAADNNNLVENDKMAKLRPLIEKLNQTILKYIPISSCMSIDESMIPYFGRNGCKQFIRGKPIRFGYKAWVLATPSGYCVQFDIYQGRNKAEQNKKIGLGDFVVTNFANLLKHNFPDLQFSLFFDNFFTSASLISKLGEMGFAATGTVRENRTDKCPLKNISQMKKGARGVIDSAIDTNDDIVCVRWKDNSVVTMLSNEYGVAPIRQAVRYSAKEKKKVDIPQPNMIHCYNKFMGGVDQMDNNIANYRIGFRGKKWYIPILFWMFDVSMNNAWILARKFGKKIDNLEFRRSVVVSILRKYGKPPLATGPKPILVGPAARRHGQHLILSGQTRRRCAHCKNKTTKACERCEVALHDKCFIDFHRK